MKSSIQQKSEIKNFIRRSTGERVFDTFNLVFMLLLCILMIYPFWSVLIMAFNNGADAAAGPIWFWPRKFTLDNFVYVFKYPMLQQAFIVTILRCIFGPIVSVLVCMMAAFALSKQFLPGRKIILIFFLIPMFIGGSMISNYIVIVKLGLINNFLVYILPGAFGFFTMVIMRTHIESIPNELHEAVMLDGAGYVRTFFQIILPLSKPVIAAFLFFSVVGNWLDYYTSLLYITKPNLYSLQYVMFKFIQQDESNSLIAQAQNAATARMAMHMNSLTVPTPEVLKMAVIVVATFPILFIYPFFQKYFVSGMLTGSVKA